MPLFALLCVVSDLHMCWCGILCVRDINVCVRIVLCVVLCVCVCVLCCVSVCVYVCAACVPKSLFVFFCVLLFVVFLVFIFLMLFLTIVFVICFFGRDVVRDFAYGLLCVLLWCFARLCSVICFVVSLFVSSCLSCFCLVMFFHAFVSVYVHGFFHVWCSCECLLFEFVVPLWFRWKGRGM